MFLCLGLGQRPGFLSGSKEKKGIGEGLVPFSSAMDSRSIPRVSMLLKVCASHEYGWLQLRGDIPLRGETLDPLVAEWHDGGLSGMPLRRETLDPQVILRGMTVDSQR